MADVDTEPPPAVEKSPASDGKPDEAEQTMGTDPVTTVLKPSDPSAKDAAELGADTSTTSSDPMPMDTSVADDTVTAATKPDVDVDTSQGDQGSDSSDRNGLGVDPAGNCSPADGADRDSDGAAMDPEPPQPVLDSTQEPETQPEPEPEPETQTQPQPEPETQPQPELQPEPELESQPEPQPKPEREPGSGSSETGKSSTGSCSSDAAGADGARRSRVTRSHNPDFAAKHRSFMKEYQRSVGNGPPPEPEKRPGSEERPPAKRRRLSRSEGEAPAAGPTAAPPVTGSLNDSFCWVCHHEGQVVCCEACPRVFHLKCAALTADPARDWVCAECRRIVQTESGERLAPTVRQLSPQRLAQLVGYAIGRLKSLPGSEPFIQPVDERKFPTYRDFVACPMDLATMEETARRGQYTSPAAVVADCKWILHNCILFNGMASKLTALAKSMLRMCKWEMEEIETCPDCYGNAYSNDNWFTLACPHPHLLVWARLKGFPYWPAKAMKTRDGNVDCRFFGRHDRAWVPAKECFLFSKEPPAPPKSRSKSLDACVEELEDHVKNLEKKFGKYVFPKPRAQYDPKRLAAHFRMTIPGCEFTKPEKEQEPAVSKRSNSEIQLEILERLRQGKKARRDSGRQLATARRVHSAAALSGTGTVAEPSDKPVGPSDKRADNPDESADYPDESADNPGESADRLDKPDEEPADLAENSDDLVGDPAGPDGGFADSADDAASPIEARATEAAEAECTDMWAEAVGKSTESAVKSGEADAKRAKTTPKPRESDAKPAGPTARPAKSVSKSGEVEKPACPTAQPGESAPKPAELAVKTETRARSSSVESTGPGVKATVKVESGEQAAQPVSATTEDGPADRASRGSVGRRRTARKSMLRLSPAAAAGPPVAATASRTPIGRRQPQAATAPTVSTATATASTAAPVRVVAATKSQLVRVVSSGAAQSGVVVVGRSAAVAVSSASSTSNGVSPQVLTQPLRPKMWISSPSCAARPSTPVVSQSIIVNRAGARLMIPRGSLNQLYIPAGQSAASHLGPMMVIPGGLGASQNGIVTLPAASPPAVTPAVTAVTPAEAGPVSAQLDRHAHTMVEMMRQGLERMLNDMAGPGSPQASAACLKLQMEQQQWKHKAEISELNRVHESQIADLRSSLEQEHKRALSRLSSGHAADKKEWERLLEARVAETKRKQWCASCGKEAIFYCCWNTSYCDFPCQEAQWPKHMLTCANQQGGAMGDCGDGDAGVGRL